MNSPKVYRDRIFVELMTSDRKRKASSEGREMTLSGDLSAKHESKREAIAL